MSTVAWAFVMVAFMVVVVFIKEVPLPYAMMVGPFIISLLMGNSINETLQFFLDQFNGTMKSAGLMIIFAMLYFGLLTETGFFNKIGSAVFRMTKGKMSVWTVMIMTVILTAIGMLTATIGTTYLVVFPLMMVFYNRMDFDKKAALIIVTCTCSAMCFLPWGIGMAFTASYANVEIMDLCMRTIPITFTFIPVIILEVLYFGREHKKKGGLMKVELSEQELNELLSKDTDNNKKDNFVINLLVFVMCISTLVSGVPSYLVFMFGTMITLMINFSDPKAAGPVVGRISGQTMGIIIMLVGVSMYVGIFSGAGMVTALGEFLVALCPQFMLRYFHLLLLAACVVVIRFVPFQFYNSCMPLLVSIGQSAGLAPEMVAAAYVNNLSFGTGSSPINPSTYIGTSLLEIDMTEYSNKAVPIQTVANILVILICVVLGFM